MTGWTAGYVADIEYVEGFYPAQAPARIVLACLLGGVQAELPGPEDDVHYLELGCGRGLNALLTAASNPGWRITAIDFNPTHVAIGQATARQAGIRNVRFLEADLAALPGSELARSIPPADITSLHGVWTWVGPDVRAGIVRLLDEKVVPGGAVHVGYNAMPAWQGALGMQRLIFEAGLRGASRSDRQALAGLGLAREALAAGAGFLAEGALARQLLERMQSMSPHYLSHEYMNVHWQPVFHADLCRALADAKLEWVAAAAPLENFPQLMLTDEQRTLVERQDDPIMRELVKDMFVPRQFRQDVFVRGARRIAPSMRDAALSRLVLVPIRTEYEVETTILVPAGKADVGEVLGRMMARASRGAASVGDLLATEPGRSNPCELVGVLVGSGQAQIATGPDQPYADGPAARLNRVLGARVGSLLGAQNSGALASPRLGTGYAASQIERFIAGRLLDGEREDRLDAWTDAMSADVDLGERPKIAEFVAEAATRRIPILRALGILPA